MNRIIRPPRVLRHVFVCSGCGRSIFEGDWYLDVSGEQYCTVCRPIHHRVAQYAGENG